MKELLLFASCFLCIAFGAIGFGITLSLDTTTFESIVLSFLSGFPVGLGGRLAYELFRRIDNER